ncbi:hypothetical protein JR316_0008681 [Psilocybe cubensis]|uniref:Uncharacterized protein n=2 Tax=Psilocybe cubensis TaxID=181762 RepID=A0ACB8GRR6_PSICU|nr:hypothetical protein JR316_0008681 [Psilocybe cubensis]KAH9478228.1 hypothetical protein JR316_0008681 [Psilocybe cubensis]
MSSPISIPRSSASSSSSGSESGSYTTSSPASSYISSSPSKGLYVPVHKRSPSPGSPTSTLGSSIPPLAQALNGLHYLTPTAPLPATTTPHPRVYSLQFLLSLRPNAEDGMKEKIRAGPAPELLMNRRMRKNLEFAEHQHRRVSPTRSPAPAPAPAAAAPTPTPTLPPAQRMPHSPRLAPRRNRFGPRASERRKQVLQSSLDSWRHDTALHLPATPRLVL